MTKQEHLEKALKNILAVGDSRGSPASRLMEIIRIAENTLESLEWKSFDDDGEASKS